MKRRQNYIVTIAGIAFAVCLLATPELVSTAAARDPETSTGGPETSSSDTRPWDGRQLLAQRKRRARATWP